MSELYLQHSSAMALAHTRAWDTSQELLDSVMKQLQQLHQPPAPTRYTDMSAVPLQLACVLMAWNM